METTTLMMTRAQQKVAEKAAAKEAKLYARAEKAAAKLLAKVAKEEAKLFARAEKVAKEVAKKEAKEAAKEAKEVARPTPYDGLHIVDGILYMVDEKTNNVFDYDVATETVGDRVGLWVDGIIEYAEPLTAAIPGTVVATVLAPVPGPKPAPVAQAKTAALAVKRAATKEAKAVILRAQIARLQEQLARRQSELAALSG